MPPIAQFMLPIAAAYSIKTIVSMAISVPIVVTLALWLVSEVNKYREAQNADKKKEAFSQALIALVLILVVLGFITYLGISISFGLTDIEGLVPAGGN